jgi:hypothetical protein
MLNYTLFTPKNLYYVKHGRLPANRILSKPELVEIYKKEFPEVNPKYLDKAILFWKEIKNIFKQETINVKEYEALLGWFSNLYDEYEAFVLQNIDLIKDMWIKQKNKK